MLVMPSDHAIGDAAAFLAAVDRAAAAARNGALVTFGITPERAETGYGYIQRGVAIGDGRCLRHRRVCREARSRAGEEVSRLGRLLLEQRHLPVPGAALSRRARAPAARHGRRLPARRWPRGGGTVDFLRLDKEAFAACDSDLIDYAVMEHTQRAAVVPVAMGWSDIGSWDALWEISAKDATAIRSQGNVDRRRHPQLLSAFRGRARRGDWHRGPRRRRDRRRGHGGAARPHTGGQAPGSSAGQRAPRRG